MSETVENTNIVKISIEEEMKSSYLDYAMSVIVSRAIPDVRDGLKPVHRRILYAMYESGYHANKPHKKCARITGEVSGKYHPHGTSAIYDSLVRMGQDFSMGIPLINKQGNFGSMDGDPAAAERYTEAKLAKVAHSLLEDIYKGTVDFQANYDGEESEPVVLPARFPNLLVNGGSGIAVGMATNIPTYNLGEVIDATCAMIDNGDITAEELLEIIPAPDFPTGGVILGMAGSVSAMKTGRGSVIIRGKTNIEKKDNGREAIIVTEMPYQVNKAKFVEKIAILVREKKIEGISDLRDESDRDGVRVVVEIKRDAMAEVVLSQLFTYTPLQTSFGVNMLALDGGRPRLMNIPEVISLFITFREEVINRRTNFLLNKARDKAHVLIGLAIAVANIDDVIKLIRKAPDPTTARLQLMERDWNAEDVIPLLKLVDDTGNVVIDDRIKFTEVQARAILDLKLNRLTGLEKAKIDTELTELGGEITEFLDILGSYERRMTIVKDEMLEIKEKFAVPRRTRIELNEFEHDIEDLIQKEDMVVTVTMSGYIKRVPLSTYKAQKRGGKGRSGMQMRDEDITTGIFVVNTHTPVLFFSSTGQVYKLKVYRLPLASPQSLGKAMINILPLAEGETIETVMPLPEDESLWNDLFIMFSTKKGGVRRNSLEDFHNIRVSGKIAIRLNDDDKLVRVRVCADDEHILLTSKMGKCIRFPVTAIRVFKSRTSDGVRGIRLKEGDEVIAMSVLSGAEGEREIREEYLKYANAKRRGEEIEISLSEEKINELAENEQFIMSVTVNGYGKRTSAYEYRITNRGGSGITNIVTSERNGTVVASFPIDETDQLMLVTNKGKLIRCPIDKIRIAGRNTQGVTIFRTADDEHVVSVSKIEEGESEGDEIDGEGGEGIDGADGAVETDVAEGGEE